MDVLCEDEDFDIHYCYVFWRGARGMHSDLLGTNDVFILELMDQIRNKFLDQMLSKGEAEGG